MGRKRSFPARRCQQHLAVKAMSACHAGHSFGCRPLQSPSHHIRIAYGINRQEPRAHRIRYGTRVRPRPALHLLIDKKRHTGPRSYVRVHFASIILLTHSKPHQHAPAAGLSLLRAVVRQTNRLQPLFLVPPQQAQKRPGPITYATQETSASLHHPTTTNTITPLHPQQ